MAVRGMGGESVFPKSPEPAAGVDAAQSQKIFGAGFAPKHARLFTARTNHCFAARFDNARANEKAFSSKSPILHPIDVVYEITQFFFHGLSVKFASALRTSLSYQLLDLVLEQSFSPLGQSALIFRMLFAA
jgi:hypothetical protein